MGKSVRSAFDSAASWVGVSRCEIESSFILVSFSSLYRTFLCHVKKTLRCQVRYFTLTYDKHLFTSLSYIYTDNYYNTSYFIFIAICDFEHGMCFYSPDPSADFDWTRNKGETSSVGTGPPYDHTLQTSQGIFFLKLFKELFD